MGPRRRESICRPLAASNRDAEDKKAKKDKLIEGFSVDEPDMWEGEGFGIAFQVRLILRTGLRTRSDQRQMSSNRRLKRT